MEAEIKSSVGSVGGYQETSRDSASYASLSYLISDGRVDGSRYTRGRKNAPSPDTRSTWPSPQSSTRAYRVPKRLEELYQCFSLRWRHGRTVCSAVSKECGSRGAPRASISPFSFHSVFPKRRITSRRFPERAFFLNSG